MVSEGAIATGVVVSVSLSLPCFLYGAWLMVVTDPVTWGVLKRHLAVVGVGLVLTTVPLLGWMIPLFWSQRTGITVIHAFIGVQAYAFFTLAGTGIVRILRVKWASEQYRQAEDFELAALAEDGQDLGHWRARLRIGVLGYTFLWILAYLTGVLRYLFKYSVFG